MGMIQMIDRNAFGLTSKVTTQNFTVANSPRFEEGRRTFLPPASLRRRQAVPARPIPRDWLGAKESIPACSRPTASTPP